MSLSRHGRAVVSAVPRLRIEPPPTQPLPPAAAPAALPAAASSPVDGGVDPSPSRCPEPLLRHTARQDPYYETVWPSRTSVAWVERDQLDRTARLPRDLPKAMFRSREEALDVAFSKPLPLAKILGAVQSYRTLSQHQLAAITGEPALLKPAPAVLRAAWSAGLLDAYPLDDRTRPAPWGRGSIWRPASTSIVSEVITDRFSMAEYLAATGGRPWSQSGSRPRHDTLATELALRAAEHCPRVAAVFGEVFSSADLLLRPPTVVLPPEREKAWQKAAGGRMADITLVREDGMRIAVELVANINSHFPGKVATWIQHLARDDLPFHGSKLGNGLTVLFVVAPDPFATSGSPTALMTKVQSALEAAFTARGCLSGVTDRFAVAHWRDLFPSAHEISPAFINLTTLAVSPGSRPWQWRMRPLLDVVPTPFEPVSPVAARAVIASAALLGQSPFWLRCDTQAPAITTALVSGAGLTAIPTTAPARPDQVKAEPRPLGQGQGAASDTQPPRRVLGLQGQGRRR